MFGFAKYKHTFSMHFKDLQALRDDIRSVDKLIQSCDNNDSEVVKILEKTKEERLKLKDQELMKALRNIRETKEHPWWGKTKKFLR